MENIVYGVMIYVNLDGKSVERDMSEGSAVQLRREAEKARKLAEAAFGEAERLRLSEVARALDREAFAIEAALPHGQRKTARPQSLRP